MVVSNKEDSFVIWLRCWMVDDDVNKQLECPLWCRGMPAQAAGGGRSQGGPDAGWLVREVS